MRMYVRFGGNFMQRFHSKSRTSGRFRAAFASGTARRTFRFCKSTCCPTQSNSFSKQTRSGCALETTRRSRHSAFWMTCGLESILFMILISKFVFSRRVSLSKKRVQDWNRVGLGTKAPQWTCCRSKPINAKCCFRFRFRFCLVWACNAVEQQNLFLLPSLPISLPVRIPSPFPSGTPTGETWNRFP